MITSETTTDPSFLRRQLVAFVAIGLTVNAIYAALFLIIIDFAPDQRVAASIFGYLSACLFQYAANARLTFQRRALNAGQFVRYLLCICLGLTFSTWLLATAPQWMAVPDIVLIIFVAAAISAANFFIFRLWVYRGSEPHEPL